MVPMTQASKANDRTLFHLVPTNQAAKEALEHPDNRRFVSPSAPKSGKPGLEIGFHVPPFSGGQVITRLGRNADLILRQTYSRVHVAFEIHPVTHVVMLSVRTKHLSSVTVTTVEKRRIQSQQISGDCAILYGRPYVISIPVYEFLLHWRDVENEDNVQALKDLAIREYEDSMMRLKNVRSRDLSVGPDISTSDSWYMTRLQSAKAPLVTEARYRRVKIGGGAFGKVYKTMDVKTGNLFAVKEVDLQRQNGPGLVELSRAALYREMKILGKISHNHIIECLGTKDFHTDKPLIFMPLREGNLASLVQNITPSDALCTQVLEQMLSALDYLVFKNLCHRDVKPPNILYKSLRQDKYHFELADFGFANDIRLANTFCGTMFYLAPEVHSHGVQTPKLDVWSLFVTMLEIHPQSNFPPPGVTDYLDIVRAVQAHQGWDQLKPMARMDPARRASAAQMLVRIFNGQGLTTPRNAIPELEPDIPAPAGALVQPTSPPAPRPRIIEYPRTPRTTRRPARPTPSQGILANRGSPRPLPPLTRPDERDQENSSMPSPPDFTDAPKRAAVRSAKRRRVSSTSEEATEDRRPTKLRTSTTTARSSQPGLSISDPRRPAQIAGRRKLRRSPRLAAFSGKPNG
ncbi:kinase-like domain-containing protein [Chaetomium strumarium]|uniref:non-specific serine/threonine protein kinase n=1 Tax=Chaetomium strumarium TaxID=1170767 RepID=A0AAJ0H0P1_9PEZI|nr:kinase-like domain-containing protein [Chaetomium strumarium]